MRLGHVKYWVVGVLLLAIGFAAGGSVRSWAQAKTNSSANINPPKSNDDAPKSADVRSSTALITALFSPEDNIQKTLINTINHAQRNILVQAYLFTDDDVANALVRAHQRGVNVEILMDAQMVDGSKGSDVLRFYEAGIPVRLETRYENAHNKIMIFDHDTDNALVVTGSYNFTYSAQKRNAENVVLIRRAPELVQRYVQNWRRHAEQAMPFSGNSIS